jgi:hypothetical protein
MSTVFPLSEFLSRDMPPEDADRRTLAKKLKIAAQQLDAPPRYESGVPVHCRGEPLSEPIYWQGRQWAVTAYGVECREGTYVIAKGRIWEDEESYGWVRHMAGKNWPDLEDFAEALRIARRRWRTIRRSKAITKTPPADMHR